MPEDLYWKGKLLVFTWHFKKEWGHFGKPLHCVLDILENGDHVLVSKKAEKYNVYHPWKRKYVCLSYCMHEHIIVIHIKPIRRPKK